MQERIPFDYWINSPLSVARFYGSIEINGNRYVIDPEADKNDPKPDLVIKKRN